MSVTMATLHVYAKGQFADYLPGGKHADLTPEMCRGVPKTNKKAESYFAFWDRKVILSLSLLDYSLVTHSASHSISQSVSPSLTL